MTVAEQRRAADEPAVPAWSAAVEAWRDAGEAPRLGYALFRLGQAQVQTGDRPGASASLAEASAIAERLKAEPLLDEIRSLASRGRLEVSVEPDAAPTELGRLGLTSRRDRVLRQVSEGRSNVEIAASLFISRKTASVHVSDILAKLGVTSRIEAATVAHRLHLFDG